MNKKDIFYCATLYGIPIYFQPEENEVIPRNKFYGFLLDYIVIPFNLFIGSDFEIIIKHKTIKRSEIEK